LTSLDLWLLCPQGPVRDGREQLELLEQVLAKLDAIFPGYKTSPEDFAW